MLTSCTNSPVLSRKEDDRDSHISYSISDIKHLNNEVNIEIEINKQSVFFSKNDIVINQFIDIKNFEESNDIFIDLTGQVHMWNADIMMTSFLFVEKNDPDILKINYYTVLHHSIPLPNKFAGGTVYENDTKDLEFLQEFLMNSHYFNLEYFIYQKTTNEISGPFSCY